MTQLLNVINLSKSFGQTQVLKDITFSVDNGEFVVIMGQSGSGKSTLLYCISRMDEVTSGEVYLQGENIAHIKDDELSDIRLNALGFIFQHAHLLKDLTIEDNIMLPGIQSGQSKDNVAARAVQLMKQAGIDHIAKHDIQEVSGGQLQRAAICRALINQPEILIGDEPTGALNSKSSLEIMDIMNEINDSGTTVIIVTHDTKVAVRASRILYLKDGKLFDELSLGHYQPEQLEERTEVLKRWLDKMGF